MKEFDGLADNLVGKVVLDDAVELLERSMIECAMEKNDGNRSAASRQLGIHRNTLQRKLEEYGLAGGEGSGRTRRKPVAREGRARRRKASAG